MSNVETDRKLHQRAIALLSEDAGLKKRNETDPHGAYDAAIDKAAKEIGYVSAQQQQIRDTRAGGR